MACLRAIAMLGLVQAVGLSAACGGRTDSDRSPLDLDAPGDDRTFLPEGARCPTAVPPEVLARGSADPLCQPQIESIESDLNGDGHLDMRRVYLRPCPTVLGEVVRPQILCREADLNFDGRKDVFRVFAEGTALYEDQDWDFDGVLDARVRFAGGVPISMAFGAGLDGDHPQMIVLLQAGQLRRVKRHVVGDENYDIHELFQVMYGDTDPSLFSIGVDFDGDGFMDRQVIPQDVVPDEPVEDEGAAEEAGGEEEGS